MSKYYTWGKSGNKIKIDTGYKSFDNYISCIFKGSAIGRGQVSLYIRPYNETYCNNNEYQRGYLRDYDLSMFGDNITNEIRNWVKQRTENVGCVLYAFSTKNNVFGYIIEQNNEYSYYIPNNKNFDKKYNCLRYITKILEEN